MDFRTQLMMQIKTLNDNFVFLKDKFSQLENGINDLNEISLKIVNSDENGNDLNIKNKANNKLNDLSSYIKRINDSKNRRHKRRNSKIRKNQTLSNDAKSVQISKENEILEAGILLFFTLKNLSV